MSDNYSRMRQIVGTSSEWLANDIVLGNGEIALERVDALTIKLKIGDGVKKFSQAPYFASGISEAPNVAGLYARDGVSAAWALLGNIVTQNSNAVNITGGTISGISSLGVTGPVSLSIPLPVTSGGTGASALIGYVKGNGANAMTASATVPVADISGTIPVSNGGTGATTLTGYVKGNGTGAFTASASVPAADISGTLPVNKGGTGLSSYVLNGILYANSTSSITTSSSLTFNGSSFIVNGTAGIGGDPGLAVSLFIGRVMNGGGAPVATGVLNSGTIQSSVTTEANYFTTSVATQAASFTLDTLRHYRAYQGNFGAGSAVTNQFGFYVSNTLIGAVNNYGFYGDIPAGANRWNLYMNGAAPNYIAGSLGIGTTSLADANLSINKPITGAATAYGVIIQGNIQSDVTSGAIGCFSGIGTAAAAFTVPFLNHFTAAQGTFGAGSIVTTQTGYSANTSLIGAANNRGFQAGDIGGAAATTGKTNTGFYSNLSIATGGGAAWNFYAGGTAPNYFAGSLGIGTFPTDGRKLTVGGMITNIPSSGGNAVGVYNSITFAGDVTNAAQGFNTLISTEAVAHTVAQLIHYKASQGTIGAGTTVTTEIGFYASAINVGGLTNIGFFADDSGGAAATTGKANIGFQSVVSASTGGGQAWNFYANGTAPNYFAGNISSGGSFYTNISVNVTAVNKGGINFAIGDASHSGILSFLKTDGSRFGYIGYADLVPNGGIYYVNENGGPHSFIGSLVSSSSGQGGLVLRDSSTTVNSNFIQFTDSAQSAQYASIQALSYGAMRLFAGSDNRFVIEQGEVIIGALNNAGIITGTSNNPGIQLTKAGGIYCQRNDAANIAVSKAAGYTVGDFFSTYVNGVWTGSIQTNGSTITFVPASDERLKTNIEDALTAGAIIDALKVRQFDWKATGKHKNYGVIAQEVLPIFPEAVKEVEALDDVFFGVDPMEFVYMLLKEVQELRARVAVLEGAK